MPQISLLRRRRRRDVGAEAGDAARVVLDVADLDPVARDRSWSRQVRRLPVSSLTVTLTSFVILPLASTVRLGVRLAEHDHGRLPEDLARVAFTQPASLLVVADEGAAVRVWRACRSWSMYWFASTVRSAVLMNDSFAAGDLGGGVEVDVGLGVASPAKQWQAASELVETLMLSYSAWSQTAWLPMIW